jgi:hypothetical protein
MAGPVRMSLHPVFALISAGLVLVTVVSTFAPLTFVGVIALAVTVVTWWRYSRRTGD